MAIFLREGVNLALSPAWFGEQSQTQIEGLRWADYSLFHIHRGPTEGSLE